METFLIISKGQKQESALIFKKHRLFYEDSYKKIIN